MPRVGPFKALAFKKLTPETEKLYMVGFNASIDRYRELLAAVGRGRLNLPNDNIDVGEVTKAGKYKLTDAAYAKLLHKLEGHYADLPQDLRSDILGFLPGPEPSDRDQGQRKRLGKAAGGTQSPGGRQPGPCHGEWEGDCRAPVRK